MPDDNVPATPGKPPITVEQPTQLPPTQEIVGYDTRRKLYTDLERLLEAKVVAYIVGDRRGMETQIAKDVLPVFVQHLDRVEYADRIALYLYGPGGHTLTAWTLVNLIRQFCKEFVVVVPSRALSAATIICLGADYIIMTKQAVLGPIDPSVSTPLNPPVPGAPPHITFPVSVEAINGFIDLARSELQIKGPMNLTQLLLSLADKVHPLVLGQAFRSRSQIQQLAQRLLQHQLKEPAKIKKIVSFLCSASGSHDYTIDRTEAREELGLVVKRPTDEQYQTMKQIFDSVAGTLELQTAYDPRLLLGSRAEFSYNIVRGLVESVAAGTDGFVSRGTLRRCAIAGPPGMPPQVAVEDVRSFEGWSHSDA
jgi:hypothetical protein